MKYPGYGSNRKRKSVKPIVESLNKMPKIEIYESEFEIGMILGNDPWLQDLEDVFSEQDLLEAYLSEGLFILDITEQSKCCSVKKSITNSKIVRKSRQQSCNMEE